MSIMVLTSKEEILELLPRLKAASIAGHSNDGTKLAVTYHAFNAPTARALEESELAREEGWDLHEYTGTLDRIFFNARGERCMTVLCLERTNGDGRHHAYRSFNLQRGNLKQLVVLGVNQPNGQRITPRPDALKPE
jgi:hypothetical protein